MDLEATHVMKWPLAPPLCGQTHSYHFSNQLESVSHFFGYFTQRNNSYCSTYMHSENCSLLNHLLAKVCESGSCQGWLPSQAQKSDK